MTNQFDVIVVGGGHAGIEACFAAAKKGHQTLLISLDKNMLASMPCNPSIGGPAKGILTREIDALGGVQARFADAATIQVKMLNTSKGPAVWALRAQIDKERYSQIVLENIQKHPHITLCEGKVTEFIFASDKIVGLKTKAGQSFFGKAFVITTGTYLRSYILRGQEKYASGPDGQETSNTFAAELKKLGIKMQRLKTGTPPRVWTDSIDFSQVEKEVLEVQPLSFSNQSQFTLTQQASCWLTYTTEVTHDIIRKNIMKSAMYSGLIEGVGPRYCPSIEDKVVRFADKKRHQLFLEPETQRGDVIYISGFSSSLPADVQDQILRTLPGFAQVRVKKWAYAIEYDAIDSLQLNHTLACKKYPNLFFAGQINGTSGYEEAASQGLIAGINAALYVENAQPLVLKRHAAYIGVLIDDLVLRGTQEPYRMLTSRAEFRLLLRNDNADLRLYKQAYAAKMIDADEFAKVARKEKLIQEKLAWLATNSVSSKSPLGQKYQVVNGETLLQVLRRPEVDPHDVLAFEFLPELVIHARLDGYIKKQNVQAAKMLRLEQLQIPKDVNFGLVPNIATEARQKFLHIKPTSIGEASRISGINPADIQMLMYYLKMRHLTKN